MITTVCKQHEGTTYVSLSHHFNQKGIKRPDEIIKVHSPQQMLRSVLVRLVSP